MWNWTDEYMIKRQIRYYQDFVNDVSDSLEFWCKKPLTCKATNLHIRELCGFMLKYQDNLQAWQQRLEAHTGVNP